MSCNESRNRVLAILLVIAALAVDKPVYAQQFENVCEIPIYIIIDSTFYNAIDSLLVTENTLGIVTTDSCDISATLLQWSNGSAYTIRRRLHSVPGIDCDVCNDGMIKLAYYKKHLIWIYGEQTCDKIMKPSDSYIETKCNISTVKYVVEDDFEFTIPHLTFFLIYNGHNVEIKLKIDNNGNVIQ